MSHYTTPVFMHMTVQVELIKVAPGKMLGLNRVIVLNYWENPQS